ncbi:MAG: GerMN domain-containing protein [Firmicutes bacterium]|nr:GerMN domain-containing protein [Bacillota bacterium]
MKRTITALLIAALVALIVITLAGCQEASIKSSSASNNEGKPAANKEEASLNKEGVKADSAKTMPEAKTEQVTLYFSDSQAEKLVAETRQIAKTQDVAKSIMEELVKGPKDKGLYPTVPPDTKINAVTINGGVASVDFSRSFIDGNPGGSTGEIMAVYSVVNTLTELPGIQKVQILIDGKPVDTITGHLDTSEPLARDDSIIKR